MTAAVTPLLPHRAEPEPGPGEGGAGRDLKLITATVAPDRLEDVHTAVIEAGAGGMTLRDAVVFDPVMAEVRNYRGIEYVDDARPAVVVDLVVRSADVLRIVNALTAAAGPKGPVDGLVWVQSVTSVVRIRTGELGMDALG